MRVYGGVQNDIAWISSGIGFPESEHKRHDNSSSRQLASITEAPLGVAMGIPFFGFFAVIDPVLSFVGDTLTLPITIQANRDDKHEAAIVESDVEMPVVP